jgi:sulfite reductase (ferredoxin)
MDASPAATPAAEPSEPDAGKRSGVEVLKESSRYLRGNIVSEMNDGTDHVSKDSYNLLKFHGTYQQEDRDARKNRDKTNVGKHYMFMVRCKIPGGKVTADQYLALDELADRYANGTLRLTTRQGIQLHGVLKQDLHATIAGINDCLLTTLGACGDVERNVMCCPAPIRDGLHEQLQNAADLIAAHLAPRSTSYFEIWLNGKTLAPPSASSRSGLTTGGDSDSEPIYGKTYLPRKFKTGLVFPHDNCIDIYAQDLGFLAEVEGNRIVGYNVLVGGGMGMTHGNAKTFPFLARPICHVPSNALLNTAEAVVKLFRDHGNRADRKRARIKYVVHEWGVLRFREVLGQYIGGTLAQPKPIDVEEMDLHHGWHPQGDGKWFYGISVENGRIKDEDALRLRTALRKLVTQLRPSVRLTACQDLLLCELPEDACEFIDRCLAEHGVLRPDQLSRVRKLSMACPAIPTCGLALSESERVLPGLIDQIEVELKRLGLDQENLSVRMTGCPNGCARPYQSDIGIVGRSGDKYTLFVGGHLLGDRLNFQLRDLIPSSQLIPTLVPLLEHYRSHRQPGEGFGDYCARLGQDALQAILPEEKPSKVARTTVESSPHASSGDSRHVGNGVVKDVAAATGADQAGKSEPATIPASPAPRPARETFFAGLPGQEVRDYAYVYHNDGSVRETIVYYYEGDRRADAASLDLALIREAVYLGQVDAYRLLNVRKLSDTFHVGPPGRERADYRHHYTPEGRVEQTVIYYYGDNCRAREAGDALPLRQQRVFAGPVPL